MVLVIVLLLILFVFSFFVGNIGEVKRLDEAGYLYSVEYKRNCYANPFAKIPAYLIRGIGCSAFMCRDEQGHILTCRNYDLPHTDDHGEVTGLNVMFKMHPKGKYRSVNLADIVWLKMLKLPYQNGALDNHTAPLWPLMFLPYLTMDGMNEKGLSVSILALDVKDKPVRQEEKGKKNIMITELVRYLLDECQNIDEAIELTKKYNMINTAGHDYHLFLVEKSGRSAIFEWVNNEFIVTYQKVCTNFIVATDDGEDCYIKGKLKEKCIKTYYEQYQYGFGHGYGRFNKMVELQKEIMSKKEAMNLLQKVSQEFDHTDLTSHTQYSVIYDSNSLEVQICSLRNYQHIYFEEV